MANKVELSSPKAEETYIQNFQTYFKQKTSYQSLLMDISTPSTQTKNTQDYLRPEECRVCQIVKKPGDLNNILNQGLYYKYTSSQDFFYARDVTALLERKRQPFCIKFHDDLILDESTEYLKCFFEKKDTKGLMEDIKQFYCQFYNFPKVFQKPFCKIINNNIARHRRLEYIKVFQNNNPTETDTQENALATENRFSFMHMLGETFLRDNNKTNSISVVDKASENKKENGRETELYLEEIEANFHVLKNAGNLKKKRDEVSQSVTVNSKKNMLYSRNDSEAAEEMLVNMLQEFKSCEDNAKFPLKKSVSDQERRRKCSNEEDYKSNKDQADEQVIMKNKVVVQNRPQSGHKKLGLKKLHIDQNAILREYMKEVEEGKSQFDSVIERSIAKGAKTTREHSVEGRETRILRPESSKSPGQNSHRNRHGNTQRNIKGTNLIIKFTPDDLKDSVYDRDSLMNKVNQMRSSQHKLAKFNSEELKYNTPTSVQYRTLLPNDEGPSSATLKQVRVCVNSPSTLKNQSSLKLSGLRKYDDSISKTPRIRQESAISTNRVRDSRPTIRRNDLILGFESTRSSKSKESRLGLDSPGLTKTAKMMKSNPKFFSKIIEKSVPLSVRDNKNLYETVNLRNMVDNDHYPETSRSAKRPSMEKESFRSPDRGVSYQSNEKRSISSGGSKLRVEVSADKKKEISRRKVNRSSSGNHQSISDLYQKASYSKNKNDGWLKLAEVYMQTPTPQRSKSKSNGNTLIHSNNISKIDLSSKLKKKSSMDFDISESRIKERKKSPFTEDRDLTEFWSPKTARHMSSRDKSPKKSPSVKGFKHVRHASRGL